ncbi:MAG: formylglycine-generating enzyme family protein, partial [Candidatus Magnetomorum sp.]|nr:formylglycine-generating enzyme family protein [Candidatus Magnetomorum sp.]
NNTILDSQNHRPLTGQLLNALKGDADLNGDGRITFKEIWAYIAPNVTNPTQTPRAHTLPGHQNFDYVFISPKGPISNGPQPTQNFWKEPLTGITFVRLPSGCFSMGCRKDCDTDSLPVHTVCLNSFWISQHEVTQRQWLKVMESQPSYFSGHDHYPIENISWTDTQDFMRIFNEKTGRNYRLPTEAEWEYACVGAEKKDSYSGADDSRNVSWTLLNSNDQPHDVGQKEKNSFQLFDMSGNVYEWCMDTYDENAYRQHTKQNPIIKPSEKNPYRVIRGGCWDSEAIYSKCNNRNNQSRNKRNRYTGFRIVYSVSQ